MSFACGMLWRTGRGDDLFEKLGLSKPGMKIDFGKVPRAYKHKDVAQDTLRDMARMILKLGASDNVFGDDDCLDGCPDDIFLGGDEYALYDSEDKRID